MRTCKVCGERLQGRFQKEFCSSFCAAKSMIKPVEEIPCPVCTAPFPSRVNGRDRHFCSSRCANKEKAITVDIYWHCDNSDCREEFVLTYNQSVRYRGLERKGKLGSERFYCSKDCALESKSARAIARSNECGNFSLAALDAYYQKVADPTYYTELRYSVGTPLSWRIQGNQIARSTKART